MHQILWICKVNPTMLIIWIMMILFQQGVSVPMQASPPTQVCVSDKDCSINSYCRPALLPPQFPIRDSHQPISVCTFDGHQDITNQLAYCNTLDDCAFHAIQGVQLSCDLKTKACLFLKSDSSISSSTPSPNSVLPTQDPDPVAQDYDVGRNTGDHDTFPNLDQPKNVIIFVAFSLLFIFGCIIVYLILRTRRERKANQRRMGRLQQRGAGHGRHQDSGSSWNSALTDQDRLMMGIGRIPTLPPYGPWEETPPYGGMMDKLDKPISAPETVITRQSLVFESPPTYEVSFRTSLEPGSHTYSLYNELHT